MRTHKETFPYVVILKSSNVLYANLTGFIVSMLSVIFFTGEFIINKDHNIAWLIGAAGVAAVIAWNRIQHKKGRSGTYKPAFIIAAIAWLSMPYLHWLPLLLIAMYFLEHQARLPQEIGFSEDKIVMNSLISKTFYWTDLSNVILKDGLLTIDFYNNKLIQKEVEDDDDPDADEDEFNDFCRLQLARNK